MMSESCCTLYIAAASPASTGDAPDLKLMTGKTDGKTDGKAGRVRLDSYQIIVADAADAVSVNFSGRCKFLQI